MSDVLLVGRGYGRRVGLLVPPGCIDAVRAVLPFWWVDSDDAPEHIGTVDPDAPERGVRELELWVAEHAVGLVFVHAAAVTFDGRALLLPGRSGSGKTTLTAALLRAGAGYLSDEYAVLDPDGLVHPYPRPLAVRTPTGRAAVPAAGFGAATVTGPVPVGAVAALTHEPGATWAPRGLGPADAVLHLLDNTVSARSRTPEALDATVAAIASARLLHGVRGDADETAAALLSELRRPGHGTM